MFYSSTEKVLTNYERAEMLYDEMDYNIHDQGTKIDKEGNTFACPKKWL